MSDQEPCTPESHREAPVLAWPVDGGPPVCARCGQPAGDAFVAWLLSPEESPPS